MKRKNKAADENSVGSISLVSVPPHIWVCPACQNEMVMNISVTWCGKTCDVQDAKIFITT